MPDVDTSAIDASGVVHAIERPLIVRPSDARSRAVSRSESPTYTVATFGVRLTFATAGPTTVTGTVVTIVVSAPIFTVTFAAPFETPVTLPTASTVTICGFDDAHVTDRDPDGGLRSVAVSFCDCPSSSVTAAGATSTAGGSGFVESQPTAPRPLARASMTHRHLTTRRASERVVMIAQSYRADRPNASGAGRPVSSTVQSASLTRHRRAFTLRTMTPDFARIVLNDVDSDATSTTGWGRRRMRA
jgi:hypothetical protein